MGGDWKSGRGLDLRVLGHFSGRFIPYKRVSNFDYSSITWLRGKINFGNMGLKNDKMDAPPTSQTQLQNACCFLDLCQLILRVRYRSQYNFHSLG